MAYDITTGNIRKPYKKRSRLIEPLTYEQKEYHDILMKGTYIISQNKNGCTHVGYTQ